MNFNEWLNGKIDIIDSSLRENFIKKENKQKLIYEAIEYSLFAGGKRLRPVLMLGVFEMFADDFENVLPFACAIEMIHTCSLIHDDLPSMDDDDYRRGKLSNHKKFGEAVAILAGDGLLNMSFEVMFRKFSKIKRDASVLIEAMNVLANSSGVEGMIGGQIVDMFCEDSVKTTDDLEYLQSRKTGAIIGSSAHVGGLIGGASKVELEAIDIFAARLGLAFQIQDDILDVEGNQETLGKPIGSDKDNNKLTYVSLIGLDESKMLQAKLTQEAIDALKCFGERAEMLIGLCNFLLTREK